MRVAVVGTGYVGLVSSACLAELGIETIGIDKDTSKIQSIRSGIMPIYEDGLESLVARNIKRGRLNFTDDLAGAVSQADVVFIAVGTPMREDDNRADLSAVFEVVRALASHMRDYTVVATKSTVPVGTGHLIESELLSGPRVPKCDVASNPEFLREGAAIDDFLNPDRIVIGTNSERARRMLLDLYAPLGKKGVRIVATDRETAEITKYAANSFLATKIAFINEIADLCERVGGNVAEVAEAIGLDRRIGESYLQVGPGYGGSCFPKDTRAFVATADELGVAQRIVATAIAANDQRKSGMAKRIEDANGGSVDGKTLAVLGLTFKANTDDMRDAPSLTIVPALQKRGANIRAYDPGIDGRAVEFLPGIECCDSAYDAAHEADSVVVMTEWPEFREIDLERLYQRMRGRTLIDLRNIFSLDAVRSAGFDYVSIGRRPVRANDNLGTSTAGGRMAAAAGPWRSS